jgi:hypothetical protein
MWRVTNVCGPTCMSNILVVFCCTLQSGQRESRTGVFSWRDWLVPGVLRKCVCVVHFLLFCAANWNLIANLFLQNSHGSFLTLSKKIAASALVVLPGMHLLLVL